MITLMIRFHHHKNIFKFSRSEANPGQGDQIGQNFAIWAIFYGVGQIFFSKKSPNDLGKILAMKKSPKIDL